MTRSAVSRRLLPLLVGVAFLCSGRLSAADSGSFYIGKPDTVPAIRVGEKDTYFVKVRTSGKPEKFLHVSLDCVGKCKRHGRWYGRCRVKMNGRLTKPCLAPLRGDGRIKLGEAAKASLMGPGATKEKVEVKDRLVMGHVYKNCLHYREEGYNHLVSYERWMAPDIGVVEETFRLNFGRGAEVSMNTRLESIHLPTHSS